MTSRKTTRQTTLHPPPPDEFITIQTWHDLCQEFGPPFRFINGFDADLAFQEADPDPDAIYVSGCCDCGPVYQSEQHPNTDLPKHIGCYDWASITSQREQYVRITMGSVKDGRCDPTHRFAMKTDRYTWGTFQTMPPNWWTVNACVDEPGVMNLPFGFNTDGPGLSYLPRHQGQEKTDLLYINFQLNSHTRLQLHEYWRAQPWATFSEKPDLPVETYLDELSRHKFCLAPPGNGLDAYRVWECIYLGVIPILEDSRWSRHVARTGLPVVILPRLYGFGPDLLAKAYQSLTQRSWNYETASLSYWREVFSSLRTSFSPAGA